VRTSVSECPEVAEQSRSALEATYKAREVEGFVDLYFYRKIGFKLAQFFARCHLTPAAVTLLGGLIGLAAGHLYYYRSLPINILGMVLHIVANAFDNADGQLARLTNQRSRSGRMLDSFVDHLIFITIYIHLALRSLAAGTSPMIFLLAVAAGISQAVQGAATDYFRNGYLYFVKGRAQADWHTLSMLQDDYRKLSWRTAPWEKFRGAIYLNFTSQQEKLSPNLSRLHDAVHAQFGNSLPDALRSRYRDTARPMLRWWGLQMTNGRMLFLFLFLAIDRPWWFFWLQLTVLNVLLIYLIVRQEKMARTFLELIHA
jgi:phosphatidylglycerophosphate synthase